MREAYSVYQAMLPLGPDWPGTRVIAEQTSTGRPSIEGCIAPAVADRFKEAITDYNRLSKSQWALQKLFLLKGKYELLSPDSLKSIFEHRPSSYETLNDNWKHFYKSYPGSGGVITLSVVGFNSDRTVAVVWAGVGCGSLCGEWQWHLLEKKDGTWKEVPGVMCHTVS